MRLSELFARHGATVLGLCRLMLRHREEAEDAVQQTFLAAYRSLLNGTEPRHPAAWLATIARKECWGRVEQRMREPLTEREPESTLPDPVASAAARADLAQLWRAIGELPRRQRQALLLREFSGLSYVELASALAISEPAVESLLFRARRELRLRLKPAYGSVAGLAPLSAIRDALARAIGGMPDPATTGAIAKIGAAPLVAKLAASAAVVVVAGGTVAAVENRSLRGPSPALAEAVARQTASAGPPARRRPSVVGGTSVAAKATRPRAAVIRAHPLRHGPALLPVSAAARPQATAAGESAPTPANDPVPSETVPTASVTLATAPEPPAASEPPVSPGVQRSWSGGDSQPAGDTGSSSVPGSDEQAGEETSSSGSDVPGVDGSGSSGDDGGSGSSGSGDTAGSSSGGDGSGVSGSGDGGSGSDTSSSGHGGGDGGGDATPSPEGRPPV